MQLTQLASPPEGTYVTVDNIDDWNTLLFPTFRAFHGTAEDPDAFRGSIYTRRVAGIELIAMSTESRIVCRRPGCTSTGDGNDYIVYLQTEGTGEITQSGYTAVLQKGDLTIFDSARPVTIQRSAHCHSYCIKFPQRLLSVPAVYMSDLMAVRFAASDGLTPAVETMITTLERTFGNVPPICQRTLALTTIDLVTALIHSRTGPSAGPRRGAIDKALEEMQGYIDTRLSDPELTPQVIADAHFTSLRRVYNIFNSAGLTVSGWINHRRMERCRRDLGDPLMSTVPVASIGSRWGFKTPSHFGRSFKAAFGMTPGEYRSQILDG